MIDSTHTSAIRVILIDAGGLFRASLSRVLASAGLEVAGECGTAAEAVALLKDAAADVMLLDLDMGGQTDELITSARDAGYTGQFLAMAGSPNVTKSAIALKSGALGIFLKSEPPDRLVQAIQVVAQGDIWIDRRVIQLLASELIDQDRHRDSRMTTLDERERLVLDGIVGGKSNKHIGEEMGLSESSVKNIVQRLFYKGGVNTRSQLVRMALEGSFGLFKSENGRAAISQSLE